MLALPLDILLGTMIGLVATHGVLCNREEEHVVPTSRRLGVFKFISDTLDDMQTRIIIIVALMVTHEK